MPERCMFEEFQACTSLFCALARKDENICRLLNGPSRRMETMVQLSLQFSDGVHDRTSSPRHDCTLRSKSQTKVGKNTNLIFHGLQTVDVTLERCTYSLEAFLVLSRPHQER